MLSNRIRDSQNSAAALLHQSASGSLAAIGSNSQLGVANGTNGVSQSAIGSSHALRSDLNIKATQLTVNPSKINRVVPNRPNLKTTNSQSSSKNILASKESTGSLRQSNINL